MLEVPVVTAIPRPPCDDSFNVKPIPAPVQLAWSASPGFSVTALHGPAD